jgi:hypothetical protein
MTSEEINAEYEFHKKASSLLMTLPIKLRPGEIDYQWPEVKKELEELRKSFIFNRSCLDNIQTDS